MKCYDPGSALIYIHIPKTAGTSVKSIFNRWYSNRIAFHYYDNRKNRKPRKIPSSDISKEIQCIYGHFNSKRGFGVLDYYPSVIQFVTFVRDPFDQALSLYKFSKRNDIYFYNKHEISALSLKQYLMEYPTNFLCHFPRVVTKSNYRDVIEEYFVEIGLVERFNESMFRIANKLDKKYSKKRDFVRLNSANMELEDVENLRLMYRDANPLDYMIYDYIKKKYE